MKLKDKFILIVSLAGLTLTGCLEMELKVQPNHAAALVGPSGVRCVGADVRRVCGAPLAATATAPDERRSRAPGLSGGRGRRKVIDS